MSTRKGMKPQQGETHIAEAAGASDAHSPRRMTFAENVILTIKVLTGFGLLGVALWGINLWTSAK